MTLFTAIKTGCIGCSGKLEGKTVQPVKTIKKKPSRADKKQIERAIARANWHGQKKENRRQYPHERMWPDGICRISDSHYTKTIQFADINYQLSKRR